jgi:hypothetical protein
VCAIYDPGPELDQELTYLEANLTKVSWGVGPVRFVIETMQYAVQSSRSYRTAVQKTYIL